MIAAKPSKNVLNLEFKKRFKTLGIDGGFSFVLGCSGGLDSMVLAELLRNAGVPFLLCHVHHNQRKSANRDQLLVKSWASKNGVPFYGEKLSLLPGASENVLRNARRKILIETAKKQAKTSGIQPVVLTAHHAGDQLETYLFKLIRGAHPKTLNGIPEKIIFDAVLFFRPLLSFSKEDLLRYAKEKKIKWAEDPTNRELKFSRNQIRHKLIPLLEDLRPKASQRVLRFFETLQNENSLKKTSNLTPRVSSADLTSAKGVPIPSTRLLDFKEAMNQILGDLGQRTVWSQWSSVEKALVERKKSKKGSGPKKRFQFPGGYELFFEKDRAFLRRKIPTEIA